MLGSDRFAFETPNVIDPGDMPPSQPARKSEAPSTDSTTDYRYDRQSTERLLNDISDLQLSPNASSSSSAAAPTTTTPFDYHGGTVYNSGGSRGTYTDNDDNDVENQESVSFLSDNANEEKKSNLEPSHYYQDNPKSHKTRKDGSRRFGFDPNKYSDRGHARTGSSDQHSLPAIEEARTYAASLLHSANKTTSWGSSSHDPFAVQRAPGSTTRATESSSRRHESIDRNKNKQSKHLVRRELCSLMAKVLIVILLCVMGGMIVAIIVKTVRGDHKDSSHSGEVPTKDGQPPLSRLEKTYDFITKYLMTNPEELNIPSSPQYMAATWIAQLDGLVLEVPASMQDPNAKFFVQRFALATLYYSTNGNSSWRDKLGFLTETNECSWFGPERPVANFGSPDKTHVLGVTCNGDLEVVNLLLPSNQLQGPLPKEIGHLTALNLLAMPHNQLAGTIPPTMFNLVNLEYLDLKFNFFQNRIPNMFQTLSELQVLGLSNNYLERGLPPSMSSLTNLKTLAIDDNMLTGDFSGTVNSLTSLEYLYADRNSFSDQVDDNFLSNLNVLREVDLSGNSFTAPSTASFPLKLLQHPTLTILDFAANDMESYIPGGLNTNNVLKFLSLRDNKLTGLIESTGFPSLRALEHLDLQGNKFTGFWPSEMQSLKNLKYLFIGNNPNILPGAVPTFAVELKQLQEFSVTNMQVTGQLPIWIEYLTSLIFLDFSNNKMEGRLIPQLFNLPNLNYLLLHNNSALVGSLPDGIVGGDKLKMFTLYDTGTDGQMDPICQKATAMELMALDCDDLVFCDKTTCCPKCCDRSATAGADAFCFEDAIPTYLQFFEGLWELNYTRSTRSFDPNLVTEMAGNPERTNSAPTPAPI